MAIIGAAEVQQGEIGTLFMWA